MLCCQSSDPCDVTMFVTGVGRIVELLMLPVPDVKSWKTNNHLIYTLIVRVVRYSPYSYFK